MPTNSKPIGVAYEDPQLDGAIMGKSGGTAGFYGTTPVAQGAALTTQLTSITSIAPSTPDYAIQDLTQTTPFGFVTKDEGNSVLSVIANLQARLAQVESRLETVGLIASN
jgi:hypothetical protein